MYVYIYLHTYKSIKIAINKEFLCELCITWQSKDIFYFVDLFNNKISFLNPKMRRLKYFFQYSSDSYDELWTGQSESHKFKFIYEFSRKSSANKMKKYSIFSCVLQTYFYLKILIIDCKLKNLTQWQLGVNKLAFLKPVFVFLVF